MMLGVEAMGVAEAAGFLGAAEEEVGAGAAKLPVAEVEEVRQRPFRPCLELII
jgi:hypothetical protein